MRTTQPLSITLSDEMAQTVHDAAVEKWLRDEVAPTYDRVMADPVGNTRSAEEAHARLRVQMSEAVAKAVGK